MSEISNIINLIQSFQTNDLGGKIADIEILYRGADAKKCEKLQENGEINRELLNGAFEIKSIAGQINVIIHAIGILLLLPQILKEGETIESMSLGAGNTGKGVDLETNNRIAEFKFIQWRGGSESIRQNQFFKDFYNLAEYETSKEKYLYVIGKNIPLRFLNGGRSFKSVFSRNTGLSQNFHKKYGDKFAVVRDYYLFKKNVIKITDLRSVGTLFSDF